jgi:hypothetical protein
VSSGFGGAQPVKQDGVILETDGCLGPPAADFVLRVGVARSMVFLPTDIRPFWMTVEEQNESTPDRPKTNAAAPNRGTKLKRLGCQAQRDW